MFFWNITFCQVKGLRTTAEFKLYSGAPFKFAFSSF